MLGLLAAFGAVQVVRAGVDLAPVDRWFAGTAAAVRAQGGAPDPVTTRTWALA